MTCGNNIIGFSNFNLSGRLFILLASFHNYLQSHEIESKIHYPIPLHLQPASKPFGYKKGDFPESEKAANETLALPISHEITQSQQEYIVERIRRFFLGE